MTVTAASDRSRAGVERLFDARSVAILGASGDPGRLGYRPVQLLKRWGFDGEIYAVNPKYDEIDGLKCVGSVKDIEEPPDVAYVVLPAAAVPEAIEGCAEHGVGAAVVSTGGFSETGAEGRALEERVREIVRNSDLRLLGPNCEGIWNVHRSLPLTFGSAAFREDIRPGPIAVVSQSGSFGAGVAQGCLNRGLGCGYLVTTGNEVDLTVSEIIEYLSEREEVGGIVGFVEGVQNAERFLAACEKARRAGISLGFLRAGKSSASVAAMQSHTGRIVSSDTAYSALFRQAGITRIETLEGLWDFAESVTRLGRGRPGALGVVSLSGGACSVILDECDRRGVPMACFTQETGRRLAERLPAYATITNPVDPAGVTLSDPRALIDTVRIVLEDPGTGGLLLQLANRGRRDIEEFGDEIAAVSAAVGKPVVVSFIDGLPSPDLIGRLHDAGLACFGDPTRAAASFAGVLTGSGAPAGSEASSSVVGSAGASPASDAKAASSAAASAASPGSPAAATWAVAEAALAPAAIPFAKTVRADSADRLAEACRQVGFPS